MTGDTLIRFGVAVPERLLREFDRHIESQGIPNRSEALRQLIRDSLAEKCRVQGKGLVYGSITISYNHHTREACSILTDVQHRFSEVIVCTTHVHADQDNCLEVIVVKGEADIVQSLIQDLSGIKAVNNLSPVVACVL